ncbi:D-lactaldehyde dehydrogenase [Cryptococcus wingfieldii CBS 7118]|uniref:D-lactaldehyde dehydrogenase n=1 Tax=Cryptococcus wingfieldii CBS 7118 TaxID=1295528 RepID=A0A1E3K515_9TREE|nr:D-lactaldehyde dehydrogenase [Cryptococcus wingfieldii CBS 7118]ODO07587.1 D-lactaldehyde dehydrogenase [Cryptococcus wingfieldii CBS 7118]
MSSSHTISKGQLVLVSGASGFVAVHTVKEFLKEGINVRGTVRSAEKGDYLKNLFKDLPGEFTYVLVKDIAQEGAFDEAVKGVDAIAHLASPFYVTNVSDANELIGPAVQGTTGILKSAQKNNPSVKRIVVTSSVAAVTSPITKKSGLIYTEEDWNVDSIPYIEKNGVDDGGSQAYMASKTAAEKALWYFIEKEKPSWDAATINPSLVLGEVLQQVDKVESLNTSVALFYQWASGQKSESDLPAPMYNWVDVKDVALAHVRALTVPEAGGQRFITSNGKFSGQDFVDSIHKHFPDVKDVPVGKPGSGAEATKDAIFVDGSKAQKVLGFKYRTLDESVKDMFESIRTRFGTI